MSAFLSALMPELDYDAIYATPSILKEWVQGGGPHAKTAAFVKADAAPVMPGTARELLHNGGAKTSFALHALEGVC